MFCVGAVVDDALSVVDVTVVSETSSERRVQRVAHVNHVQAACAQRLFFQNLKFITESKFAESERRRLIPFRSLPLKKKEGAKCILSWRGLKLTRTLEVFRPWVPRLHK